MSIAHLLEDFQLEIAEGGGFILLTAESRRVFEQDSYSEPSSSCFLISRISSRVRCFSRKESIVIVGSLKIPYDFRNYSSRCLSLYLYSSKELIPISCAWRAANSCGLMDVSNIRSATSSRYYWGLNRVPEFTFL